MVWVYRHPETNVGDIYDWYSLLCDKTFFVGGRKFRRGSGRWAENSSSRHGRLDWHATKDAIRAWLQAEQEAQGSWEHQTREIESEEFHRVLPQAPGHDFIYGHDKKLGRVVPMPDGEFAVYCYEDTWANTTMLSVAAIRDEYPGMPLTDACEQAKGKAHKRLKKMLHAYYRPWHWVEDGVDF